MLSYSFIFNVNNVNDDENGSHSQHLSLPRISRNSDDFGPKGTWRLAVVAFPA